MTFAQDIVTRPVSDVDWPRLSPGWPDSWLRPDQILIVSWAPELRPIPSPGFLHHYHLRLANNKY